MLSGNNLLFRIILYNIICFLETNLMVTASKKSSKMFVYIREFDKYDDSGKLLCRNTICFNYPESPYRRYCSKKCSKDFEHWYYHNFYWDRVRSDIFKRDNYTCQICKRRFPYTYRRRFAKSKKLQCDHVIPRSLYKQHGYKYDTLENKITATLEFFHNPDNLRTLCYNCHKQVTLKYIRSAKKVAQIIETGA
jgi:5-methylcytosine-specific restriction endonuclease McrA